MRGMKPFSHKFACVPIPRFELGTLKRDENLRVSTWKTKNYVPTKFRTHHSITILI